MPFTLVDATKMGLVLFALNKAARASKLYRGQRLTDARATVPELISVPAQPEEDARALKALAHWCSRYSPFVNKDGEDGLWIEVSTSAHLFGGEKKLLKDIQLRLGRFGITTRLGIADTLGAAWALARYSTDDSMGRDDSNLQASVLKERISLPGTLLNKLTDFPVSALRLSNPTIQLLKRLGLRRIRQISDLPRHALKHRFPSKDIANAVLLRLDQALGRIDEPRKSLLPIARYIARISFAEPLISTEGVETALDSLCHELCAQLAKDFQGARQIIFTIYRTDGTSASVSVGTSIPSNNSEHISRLLNNKIGNLNASFGIDLITLIARVHEPLRPAQSSFSKKDTKIQEETNLLIDRLTNRLDKDRVYRLCRKTSHIPERAQGQMSALKAIKPWGIPDEPMTRRPILMLPVPENIMVIAEIPDGPPKRFTWRRITRDISRIEGPERISPEWWHIIPHHFYRNSGSHDGKYLVAKNDGTEGERRQSGRRMEGKREDLIRDYYFIEDEIGERYWIYRAGLYHRFPVDVAPQWFLQGFFA